MVIENKYKSFSLICQQKGGIKGKFGAIIFSNEKASFRQEHKMGRKRKYRFPNGINGVDRFYHPYRSTPPAIFKNGLNYIDISAETSRPCDMFSDTDPNGMYTGVSRDGSEPIQDADDL